MASARRVARRIGRALAAVAALAALGLSGDADDRRPPTPRAQVLARYRELAAARTRLERAVAGLALQDSADRATSKPYVVVDGLRGVVELRLSGVPLHTAPIRAARGWPPPAAAAVVNLGQAPGDSLGVRVELPATALQLVPHTSGAEATLRERLGERVRELMARLRGEPYLAVSAEDLEWLRPALAPGTLVVTVGP